MPDELHTVSRWTERRIGAMADKEIMFRGKRKDGNGWVEGYYVCHSHCCHTIVPAPFGGYQVQDGTFYAPESYLVDPATLGQYAGKEDMVGRRAFTGDIIVPCDAEGETAGIIRFGENRLDTAGRVNMEIGFWVEWRGGGAETWRKDLGYWLARSRIVGNYWDGLELPPKEGEGAG